MGQSLECSQDVVNEQITIVAVDHTGSVVDHGVGAPLFECGGGKPIAVERVTLKSKKYRAGRTVAAVGSDLGVAKKNIVKLGNRNHRVICLLYNVMQK